jgi:hypothetical protein
MEKTASFTAKLAGGMSIKKTGSRPTSPTPKPRTSVNPTSRAAMDAEYRTSLYLRQVRNNKETTFYTTNANCCR